MKMLNFDDQVAVLRRCGRCGGTKTLMVLGQTVQCTACDKNGRVLVGMGWHQFVVSVKEELARIAQAQGWKPR
jgi:hypothetical protein